MKIQKAIGDIISWGNFVPSLKTKEEKENFEKTEKKAKLFIIYLIVLCV